jgi:predicted Na+-dependent transporter
VFVAIAMLFVLIGLAWLAWFELFPANQFFWGFFVVAGLLLVLGVLAGWLAARALRRGSPPSPTMAIDEARKIREAVGPREDVA